MNISNYYWYFQSVIPPRICDMIVQYGKAEKEREVLALTGGFGRDRDLKKAPLTEKEVENLKKKRDVQDSVVRTKDKVMESLDTKGKLGVRTKVKLSDTNKAVANIVDKK